MQRSEVRRQTEDAVKDVVDQKELTQVEQFVMDRLAMLSTWGKKSVTTTGLIFEADRCAPSRPDLFDRNATLMDSLERIRTAVEDLEKRGIFICRNEAIHIEKTLKAVKERLQDLLPDFLVDKESVFVPKT